MKTSLMSRSWHRWCVLVAVAVAALALGGNALANAYGPKVDDRVATAADADSVKTDYLNLFVNGSDPYHAVQAVKGQNIVSLGGSAVTADVQIQSLQTLANDSRVSFISPDLPSYPTGTFTPATR